MCAAIGYARVLGPTLGRVKVCLRQASLTNALGYARDFCDRRIRVCSRPLTNACIIKRKCQMCTLQACGVDTVPGCVLRQVIVLSPFRVNGTTRGTTRKERGRVELPASACYRRDPFSSREDQRQKRGEKRRKMTPSWSYPGVRALAEDPKRGERGGRRRRSQKKKKTTTKKQRYRERATALGREGTVEGRA